MEKEWAELKIEIEELKRRVERLERDATTTVSKEANSRSPSPVAAINEKDQTMSQANDNAEEHWNNEARVAGTWFNRLGIVAIMLAVSFLLKWSIDNELIGESGRVVLGSAVGALLLTGGEIFRRRGYRRYGYGFSGGGLGILYFSVFAAFSFYRLLPHAAAFSLMILVTTLAVVLAVRYDSKAIGVLGIVGGFATPFVLSSGSDNRIFLYTYLVLLNTGVLTVAYYKQWTTFNVLTCLLTYIAFGTATHRFFFGQAVDVAAIVWLSVLFLLYLAVSIVQTLREAESFRLADTILTTLNAVLYFACSYALMLTAIQGWKGSLAAILGSGYLLLAVFLRRRYPQHQEKIAVFWGVAALLMTVAIPLQYDGYWRTVGWAIETIVLFKLSLMLAPMRPPATALIVMGLTILSLFTQPFRISGAEVWPLLNRGALAHLAVIAAVGWSAWLCQRAERVAASGENHGLARGLLVVMNGVIILFFTRETIAYYEYQVQLLRQSDVAVAYYKIEALLNTKSLMLSLVWGLHAGVLIAVGFWRRVAAIRQFGLLFISCVILKVFVYDLSHLSTPNRILSFMALGVMLLGVSWVYTRYKNH